LRKFATLLLCLASFAAAAEAAKKKPAPKFETPVAQATPKVEFEKYTLPNGLNVILHVDRKLPIVHVNEWFHVGSKNERRGRTGFAHLFEHMMFEGSANATAKYFTYAEKAGANLREGGVNGTTNFDRTNYFVTAPSGNLEFLLWLESDRVATLGDALTKEKLDNQRDVVKNERRQGLENTPYGRWFKLMSENLFPADHPYSWPVIGSHEDLTAASLDDVKEFFHQYYAPNNLTLTIAGDFDPAEAKALVAKYFGPIPAGPPLDRPRLYIPKLDGEKIVTARPGTPLPQVESIVSDELARLARSGPTAEELARAKTKQEYNFVTGLERIGGFGGKADLLAQYNTYLGDPNKFDDDLKRYRAVSAADVQSATGRWLDTKNRLLIRFHPEISGRNQSSETIDRKNGPAMGTDRPFNAPPVQSATLDNGMTVFVVERHELPKVAVTFVTRAGTVGDAAGKEGTATLLIRVIDHGTKTRNALQISDELGNLGTSMNGFASREWSQMSLDVLRTNLDHAFAVMADVALHPLFPQEEFDRERKLHLDALGQDARNANALASRIRPILLFGPDHPYGRPTRGLPSTVANITRDELAKYHADWWKPGSSALVFAGDITLADAVALAKKEFGSWSGGSAPTVTIPAPKPAASGKIYVVDRQDAAQTVVSQSLLGPKRKTDDYYALSLADAVWGGGGFGTRLNLNLREEKGYSYGVFSNPGFYSQAGLWTAGGGVQTNKTKESVVEFLKELDAIAGAKPVTEAELENAKLVRVRGYAQSFESLGRLTGQVASLWAQDLPMTELQREPEQVMHATLDAVNAAAKKYAIPSQQSLLLVGDLAKIEPGLKEINAGEIVVLDVEGKPVKK
jgi:predicted Zn-dependent peptidase